MTNEIEALLARLEEDEEGEVVLELLGLPVEGVSPPPAEEGQVEEVSPLMADAAAAEPVRAKAGKGEEGRSIPWRAGQGETAQAPMGQSQWPTRRPQAAAQARRGAGQETLLTARVRRLGEAADYAVRRPAGRVDAAAVETGAQAGLTAGALDLLMERDARRYDGGFSLY